METNVRGWGGEEGGRVEEDFDEEKRRNFSPFEMKRL
jgi:hypothetical protein